MKACLGSSFGGQGVPQENNEEEPLLHNTPMYPCRGDPSDEFRFATFFPVALHPVMDRVASLCSQLFRVGLQQAAARAESGSSLALNAASLPGSDSAEAARRR